MIDLDSLSAAARQAVEGLQAENLRLSKIIALKDEQIRFLNFRLFGPKSDKLSVAQTALLFEEASVSAGEVEQETSRPDPERQAPLPKAKPPRPNHPGRERLAQHLERRELIIPCCPEDCRCSQVRRRASGDRL